MSREYVLQLEFGNTRPVRVRPHPMSAVRTSVRNWLLPAPSEFSGHVATRTHAGQRPRHLA
jgi:hypothetical protein